MIISPGVLVAFDLDDTLYKERDYVMSGRRAVARHFAALTPLTEAELNACMEGAKPVSYEAFDAVARLIAPFGFCMSDILEVYRNHEPEISLSPGVRELLLKLRAGGASLALITDGRSKAQRAKLRALGIDKLFDAVYISEETGGDKVSGLPFRLAEKQFKDRTQRRIYVGDNPAKDFREARLGGWSTVMIADPEGVNIFPQHLESVAPEARPDRIIFLIDNLN